MADEYIYNKVDEDLEGLLAEVRNFNNSINNNHKGDARYSSLSKIIQSTLYEINAFQLKPNTNRSIHSIHLLRSFKNLVNALKQISADKLISLEDNNLAKDIMTRISSISMELTAFRPAVDPTPIGNRLKEQPSDADRTDLHEKLEKGKKYDPTGGFKDSEEPKTKESNAFMSGIFAAITRGLERLFYLLSAKSDTEKSPTSPRLSTIDPPSSFNSELKTRSESVTQNIENQKKEQETINAGVAPSSNSPQEPIIIRTLEELAAFIELNNIENQKKEQEMINAGVAPSSNSPQEPIIIRTLEELDEALGFKKTEAESKEKKSTEDNGPSRPTR